MNDLGITRRQASQGLVIGGIILFLVFGWLWWTKIFTNPKNVFWDMVANNLATSSVSRHVLAVSGNQKLNQYIELELGQHNRVRSLTTLSQPTSTVITETIGTPTTDYNRYISIKTSIKNKAGKSINFKSILGVWAISPRSPKPIDYLSRLFGQTLLAPIPIGDLSAKDRNILVASARSVYTPDFSTYKKVTLNGVSAYQYDVSINPFKYVSYLQQFARYEGFSTLSELNPNAYRNSPPFQIQATVAIVSKQLLKIVYGGGNRSEYYSGYGDQQSITPPTHSVSTKILQGQLSALEK